ncbi:MAG: hypothetical protein RL681_698 [Candidatus Parcubacteria bacterium]|jgi:hypothetical protein
MIKRFAFPVVAIVAAAIILAMQISGAWNTSGTAQAIGSVLIFAVLAWLAVKTTKSSLREKGRSAVPLDGMSVCVSVPDPLGDFGELRLATAQALKGALQGNGAHVADGPDSFGRDSDVTIVIGAMDQEVTVRPGRSGSRLAERRISVIVRLLKPRALSGESRLLTICITQLGVTDSNKAALFAETIVQRMEARRGPDDAWVIGWT